MGAQFLIQRTSGIHSAFWDTFGSIIIVWKLICGVISSKGLFIWAKVIPVNEKTFRLMFPAVT
jgi:hypothetical protein